MFKDNAKGLMLGVLGEQVWFVVYFLLAGLGKLLSAHTHGWGVRAEKKQEWVVT